jgi:hypothetical protein
MKVTSLMLIITLVGLVSFMISLLIIFLGKRVGEKGSGQQQIKISNYIQIGTNSVLMLVIITAAFAISPLALTYWKPDVTAEAEEYSKITLGGHVYDENEQPALSVDLFVIREYDGKMDTAAKLSTGRHGEFSVPLENCKPSERFWVVCYKPGDYIGREMFTFNYFNSSISIKRPPDMQIPERKVSKERLSKVSDTTDVITKELQASQ